MFNERWKQRQKGQPEQLMAHESERLRTYKDTKPLQL